jgi:L-methionine (R)-S-oxide reductase
MHAIQTHANLSKPQTYSEIQQQLTGVFSGERNALANAANMSALLFQMLPDLNWAGFYFLQQGELVLGPFQGKVACVRIEMGKGVCGTAAAKRETLLVQDVHAFPGHIACDAASQSEVVVPLIQGDRLWGVLDLDSPNLARFDQDDAKGLQQAAELLLDSSDMAAFFGHSVKQ